MNKIDRLKILIRYAISEGIIESQKDLGRQIGYSNESSFSQIINEKVNMPKDFIKKLKSVFPQINEVWIKEGSGSMFLSDEGEMLKDSNECITPDYSQMSKTEKITALKDLMSNVQKFGKQRDKIYLLPLLNLDAVGGVDNDVVDAAEYINEMIPVSGAKESSICMPISGDSMIPVFYPGDIVVMDEVAEWSLFLEMGQYYVIILKDGRRLIKKITHSEVDKTENMLLISENSNYPPVELPKKLIQRIFIVTQKHQKLTL